MTHQSEGTFYANELLEEFDYTVVENLEPIRQTTPFFSTFTKMAAAVVAGGLFVFGPFGISMPNSTPQTDMLGSVVVVHAAHGNVAHVAVSDAHQRAAERFRKLFRAVPLNDVERLTDPVYGL